MFSSKLLHIWNNSPDVPTHENNVFKDGIGVTGLRLKLHGNNHGNHLKHYGKHHDNHNNHHGNHHGKKN